MKIDIEEYRGQTIKYDDESDKFLCDVSVEDRTKNVKRGSLKDLRKEIDLFIKENLNFKPFKALLKSDYNDNDFSIVEVKAIRTDKKLIVSTSDRWTEHFDRKKSDRLMVYDYQLVKEKEEIEKEESEYKKIIKEKMSILYTKLIKMDLSKYDLI